VWKDSGVENIKIGYFLLLYLRHYFVGCFSKFAASVNIQQQMDSILFRREL
jgi:hypothetical protein